MKANYRFTLLAVALSCIAFAGTTFALVSLDAPVKPPVTSVMGGVDELRLSPIPAPELSPDPASELSEQSSRLGFVRRDFSDLEIPEETVSVAATPDSWAVEVMDARPATPKLQQAAPKTRKKSAKKKRKTRYTLKQRLAEISPTARDRLLEKFKASKAVWPPAEIAYVGIKDKKVLEVYARAKGGAWSFVHRYKVLAASGKSGPKLQRGDKQVPEGVYRISYLNPNSAYHVSLRVNYPNRFDRKMAKKDGRKDLGGDIMIHGKNVSAGCLAVGDAAAEELFVLAAEVGKRNIKVVIAPTDFRDKDAAVQARGPDWVPGLYAEIATAMSEFEAPKEPSLLSLLGF